MTRRGRSARRIRDFSPSRKVKKKRPLHRQLSKKMKKSVTGIEEGMDRFFVGGERKMAGFMHAYIRPRLTEEYEKMKVTDLVRRIEADLKELLARAYPTSTEEWMQRIAPNSRLLYRINQGVAEQLCRGLWERIISRDKTVTCKAREEY